MRHAPRRGVTEQTKPPVLDVGLVREVSFVSAFPNLKFGVSHVLLI